MTGVAKGCTDGLRRRRGHRLDPELDRGAGQSPRATRRRHPGLHREVLDRRRRRRRLASIIRDDGAAAVASGQEDVAVAVGASAGGRRRRRAGRLQRESRAAATPPRRPEVAQARAANCAALGVGRAAGARSPGVAAARGSCCRAPLAPASDTSRFPDSDEEREPRQLGFDNLPQAVEVAEGGAVVEIDSDAHAAPRRCADRAAPRVGGAVAEERRDAGEHEPLAPAEECVPVEGGAVHLAAEGRLAPLVVRPRAVARVDDVQRAQVARRALHAATSTPASRATRAEVAERAVRQHRHPAGAGRAGARERDRRVHLGAADRLQLRRAAVGQERVGCC